MNVIDRDISLPAELHVPEQFNSQMLEESKKRIAVLMHNREALLQGTEVEQKVRCFVNGEKIFSVAHTPQGNRFVSLGIFLGDGCYKRVKVGVELESLKLVALGKITPKCFQHEINKEVFMMKVFKESPRAVNYIDNYQTVSSLKDQEAGIPKKRMIVTEFCDQGTLFDYRLKGFTSAQYPFLFWRFAEVAEGLIQMHEKKIVHSDIKSENIFFHEGRAKIGDFGGAQKEGEGCLRGTFLYWPIEKVLTWSQQNFPMSSADLTKEGNDPDSLKFRILESGPFEAKISQDIWCFGMVLFEAFFGNLFVDWLSQEEGFQDLGLGSLYEVSSLEQLHCLKDAFLRLTPEKMTQIIGKLPQRNQLEKKIGHILKKILILDPLKRPTAKEVRDFFGKPKSRKIQKNVVEL